MYFSLSLSIPTQVTSEFTTPTVDVFVVPYNMSLTLYGTISTSTASLSWTAYDSHITHDMLPEHQININEVNHWVF